MTLKNLEPYPVFQSHVGETTCEMGPARIETQDPGRHFREKGLFLVPNVNLPDKQRSMATEVSVKPKVGLGA